MAQSKPMFTLLVPMFFLQSASASTTNDSNSLVRVSITIPVSDLVAPKSLDESSIYELLTSKGLQFDTQSKVMVHNEDKKISLDCFNCIIRIVDYKTLVESAVNERQAD